MGLITYQKNDTKNHLPLEQSAYETSLVGRWLETLLNWLFEWELVQPSTADTDHFRFSEEEPPVDPVANREMTVTLVAKRSRDIRTSLDKHTFSTEAMALYAVSQK